MSKFRGAVQGLGLLRPNTFWVNDGSWELDRKAPEIFSKVAGGPGYGRRLGRRFVELASTVDYGPNVILTWRADMRDADFVYQSVIEVLKVIAPSYHLPRGLRFDVIPDRDFFRVETNLDFEAITESFYARMGKPVPPNSKPLEAGNLLMYLVDARTELIHASRDNAELTANPANAAVLGVKWQELLHARGASQHEIEQFQQDLLADGNEIAGSIRKRYRRWHELLPLLQKARELKFKDWLKERNPDASLIGEYYKALTAKTWIEKLPAKQFRFLICTIAGLTAPPPI